RLRKPVPGTEHRGQPRVRNRASDHRGAGTSLDRGTGNQGSLGCGKAEVSMPETAQSPLAIYQAHLDKGELAYQWSPKAGRAVFYPRLVCPYSGSTELEW